MKLRRRREERKPVRIITNEWVENNCIYITKRDMEMLKLLKRFPLMNSEHLRLLTPGTDDAKPFYELQQGQKRCNERIRALYDLHCINKWSPRLPVGEGTSKQYVALDRAGLKLLELDRRPRHELPMDWKHQSLILDIYCELIKKERNRTWEIKYLQREQSYESGKLVPDLSTILKCNNQGSVLFIEVDRSEKKQSLEKEKLRAYREWQLSGLWKNESWNSVLPKPIFPTVLYVFDEEKKNWKRRASVLRKTSHQLGLKAEFIGMSEFSSYMYGLFHT